MAALRWTQPGRSWCVGVGVFLFVAAVLAAPLHAQSGPAKYLGGTLGGSAANIQAYKVSVIKGTFSTVSDVDLVFSDGKKTSITIPYGMITALTYGLEPGHRGAYGYPWDSYEQFTKKRHYLLTIVFQPPQDTAEQAVAFELDKSVVKPTLDRLQARSGKEVTFINAVACTEFRTAAECGHGQPGELAGLTRVYIDAQGGIRDLIASEITASQLGLTVLSEVQGAEIVLRYTSATVAQTGFGSFGAHGGMPFDAGRGEVLVVRDGRSRAVILFEDLKKQPATNFARTFVEAYRKAAGGPGS